MKKILLSILLVLFLTTTGWGASQIFQGDITGNAATVTNLTITSAFDAGVFTAATGSWTVEAADRTTFAYAISGKIMTFAFFIATSTLSDATASLNIAIPGGKTATKTMWNPVYIYNNSTSAFGTARVNAASATLEIYPLAGNLLAEVNGTYVIGQITFEIN